MNAFSIPQLRNEWLGNIRADILAGLVVALALIPEAIAFSIIAGVDPKVGLYASFSIAVIVAITGGRPGMISAATAATAVLMVTLVKEHGLEYLLAATVVAGLIQIVAGLLRLGYVMRFVSRSVMTGFVNALAGCGAIGDVKDPKCLRRVGTTAIHSLDQFLSGVATLGEVDRQWNDARHRRNRLARNDLGAHPRPTGSDASCFVAS